MTWKHRVRPPLRSFLVCLAGLAAPAAWAQQPEGKARTVRLSFEELEEADRVPLALRHPLTPEGLPEDLAGRSVAVELSDDELRLDLDGDGRFEKRVKARKPEVVEVRVAADTGEPHAPRPLLIARDGSGWWAAPAAMLAGKHGRTPLMLLDGDLDGRFDGAGDWLAYGSGSLHRIVPELPWLGEGAFLARFALEHGGSRPTLELQPLGPEPGHTPLHWEALLAANAFRTAVGLPPTRLDPERSDGCQKHALYLQLNGYDYTAPWDGVGSHDELPGNPGYTEEGRAAARDNATSGTADAAGSIRGMTATMLHRLCFLGEAASGIGVGAVEGALVPTATGYSVVGGPDPRPSDMRELVVVPAPGQVGVELTLRPERPEVEDDPDFYRRARGYPVSVSWGSLPVSRAQIAVFDPRGEPVAGRCFTPERPIHSTRPMNGSSAFFAAAGPLQARTRYEVRFTARHAGEPVSWSWSFTTR